MKDSRPACAKPADARTDTGNQPDQDNQHIGTKSESLQTLLDAIPCRIAQKEAAWKIQDLPTIFHASAIQAGIIPSAPTPLVHNDSMVRPCFLVVDREFSSGISSRKLLIETAKFNVITAYNGAEGLETLAAFPAVNVAVVDEHIEDIPCTELVQELKRRKPDLIVIVVGDQIRCKDADYYVEPFRPDKLLERLQKLFPAATDAIAKTNEALSSLEKDR